MTKEELLNILKLLSNIESTIDMDLFRKQVPCWLTERLEDVITDLEKHILEK